MPPDFRASPQFDDADLYCIRCGYNLRGLSGNPRRCPECGNDNAVEELLIPDSSLRRQFILLETAPTWCFSAALIGGIGFCVLTASDSPLGHCIGSVLVIIALPVWIGSAGAFAESCVHDRRWLQTLLAFHLYAALIFALSTFFFLGPWLVPILANKGLMRGWGYNPYLLILGCPFALFLVIWAYRRARAGLAQLQRRAAVEMHLKQMRDGN